MVGNNKRQGRPPAVLIHLFLLLLSSIDCLLQFGTGAEFGHTAGGNLDGRASLRIAAVARLALRDRESSEPDQGNAVPFFQSPGYAVYRGVDGGSRLGLADFAVSSDTVNQICFVHHSSWGGSRSRSAV